jgi:ElaB/YqjD/DUF883 family membrane-anchored ribosome-binding protein
VGLGLGQVDPDVVTYLTYWLKENVMRRRAKSERLITDLRAVVDDAEALLKATSAQTGEKVQSVRTRAEQSLQQARKRLAHVEADAAERAHKAATTAKTYVQEKPWQAIAVAAGVGFVLGLFADRR